MKFLLIHCVFVCLLLPTAGRLSAGPVLPGLAEQIKEAPEGKVTITDRLFSFGDLVRGAGGEFVSNCTGLQQKEYILTSEECARKQLEVLDSDRSVSLISRSGTQKLTVSGKNQIKFVNGLGQIFPDQKGKPGSVPQVSDQDSVASGETVALLGAGESKDGVEYSHKDPAGSLEVPVNQCQGNTCYITSENLRPGMPVFYHGKLLCIGSDTPGQCLRVRDSHQLAKREEGGTTLQSGKCTILHGDARKGECRLCNDNKNCTIKNGYCDGKTHVWQLSCENGAKCEADASYVDNPLSCLTVKCDKGACGPCSEACTFDEGWLCKGAPDGDCLPNLTSQAVRSVLRSALIVGSAIVLFLMCTPHH